MSAKRFSKAPRASANSCPEFDNRHLVYFQEHGKFSKEAQIILYDIFRTVVGGLVRKGSGYSMVADAVGGWEDVASDLYCAFLQVGLPSAVLQEGKNHAPLVNHHIKMRMLNYVKKHWSKVEVALNSCPVDLSVEEMREGAVERVPHQLITDTDSLDEIETFSKAVRQTLLMRVSLHNPEYVSCLLGLLHGKGESLSRYRSRIAKVFKIDKKQVSDDLDIVLDYVDKRYALNERIDNAAY